MWAPLVGLGDDGVSEHAVLFYRQVVRAATSSFVSTGHDPEPALLALHEEGGTSSANHFKDPTAVRIRFFLSSIKECWCNINIYGLNV